VRFHYLPDSAFVPNTAQQDEAVLRRYSAILEALAFTRSVLVVASDQEWDEEGFYQDGVRALTPGLRRIFPDARLAATLFDIEDGPFAWFGFVAPTTLDDPALTSFLLRAASTDWDDAVIFAEDFSWAFAPYEGGVDVIARSEAERDALAERFSDWPSPQREWEDTDVRSTDKG